MLVFGIFGVVGCVCWCVVNVLVQWGVAFWLEGGRGGATTNTNCISHSFQKPYLF